MPKANLLSDKMEYSRNMLLQICNLLDKNSIPYSLEGGTLLGIVRDGDLLPWDGDLDISIAPDFVANFQKLTWQFLRMGMKLSVRRSQISHGPIQMGQVRLIKVKPLGAYLWKIINPKHDIIILDVFVKIKDLTHTFWQAKGKVMRVENIHYDSFDKIVYRNTQLKVPNLYQDYLTKKYGNWNVPVKEWDCAVNELTIIQ